MGIIRKLLIGFICGILASNLYARMTTVIYVNSHTDLVRCEDSAGFLWEFYGAEDWMVGDACNLVLFDRLTDEIAERCRVRSKDSALGA